MKQKMEWIVEQARRIADTATELGGTSGHDIEAVDHLAAILQLRERVTTCLEIAEDPAEDEQRRRWRHRAAERNMREAYRRLAWAGEACARCAAHHAREIDSFTAIEDMTLAYVKNLACISRDDSTEEHERACSAIVSLLFDD